MVARPQIYHLLAYDISKKTHLVPYFSENNKLARRFCLPYSLVFLQSSNYIVFFFREETPGDYSNIIQP